MTNYSLIRRIVTAVILVELLCAVCFSCTALLHERRTRLRAFDITLQGRSDSLLGAVQDAEDPADNVFIDPTELKLPEEDSYAVYNQGGQRLKGSKVGNDALTSRSGDGFRSVSSRGKSYRIFEREALRIIDRAESDGVGLRRPITIVYAVPAATIWHEIFEAAEFYVLVSLVLVSGTALLLVFLIRRLLRPIDDLAVSARGISASALAFTPPPSALGVKELRPLVNALSGAMTRVRDAFDKEHRFVGDAAHELKTAVAVVRSSIQVLGLKPRGGEEYRQGLHALLNDNERVEELVSRMLVLARFEETAETHEARISLRACVEQTVGSLSTYALARGVTLEAILSDDALVGVSPEALRTLVTNLAVNAVQHSTRGGRVTVRAGRSGVMFSQALVEVHDDGHGIAADSLPHVFERFYREDSSRSRETGGVGLGLSICKSIVDAAHGTIEIESTEGRGTTVRVILGAA